MFLIAFFCRAVKIQGLFEEGLNVTQMMTLVFEREGSVVKEKQMRKSWPTAFSHNVYRSLHSYSYENTGLFFFCKRSINDTFSNKFLDDDCHTIFVRYGPTSKTQVLYVENSESAKNGSFHLFDKLVSHVANFFFLDSLVVKVCLKTYVVGD